ncbi:MAG: hypothetical protein R3D28_01010 [Geminicoccaceae bacterium]
MRRYGLWFADTGEGYREMLRLVGKPSGIETQTAGDLIRLDRNRAGKKPPSRAGEPDRQ